jgi:nitrogenase subunit NifH|tara:strand:- start:359 stop:553 length:195 start_codon:yes stop_codon:yes gene_type:complete
MIMESKAQRIFLDVSEERGEPSGFFVRNDLKESIEELENEGKLKVVGIIYDETYTIELITKPNK